MKAFDTPAIFHEIGSEPVDKFGVSRRRSLYSKIVGISSNGFIKMILPNPVDDRTSGEWILGVSHPFSECEAAPI